MKIVLAFTDRLVFWEVHTFQNYTLATKACQLGVGNKFSLKSLTLLWYHEKSYVNSTMGLI